MKKIFAIALALVMVLSMASAFAMNCLNIDWSTSTNCGTGSVEVVPYVLGNKAGGGNTYKQSDCAAAVNNQYVYFALKVTVADSANDSWWEKTTMTLSKADGLVDDLYKVTNAGVAAISGSTVSNFSMADLGARVEAASADGSLKAGEYYVTNTWGFSTSFNALNNLFAVEVADVNEGVEVCAKIESGAKASAAEIEINGAKVQILDAGDLYTIKVDDVKFNFEDTGKFLSATVASANNYTYYSFCDGKYYSNNGVYAEAACDNKADYKAITDAMAAINITWGQKISQATAAAKLAWSAKVSDCFTWNDEALSTVNAECQVQVMSIPKTGDASVLAWLF